MKFIFRHFLLPLSFFASSIILAAEINVKNGFQMRLFSGDDNYLINLGVLCYLDLYKNSTYFVKENESYKLLTNSKEALEDKQKFLRRDAEILVNSYAESPNSYAYVISQDKNLIGGLFYRIPEEGILYIDELIFVEPVSIEIKEAILNLIEKLDHDQEIHRIEVAVRFINASYLSFYYKAGFLPIEPPSYGKDPILYITLSKDCNQPKA
jgi:hypothetical protein